MNAPWLTVLNVYGAALLQGLVLVSFPASAALLMSMHGIDDARYGAIFLPQVACAVAGAMLGARLATRVALEFLLVLALCANALSQLALAATAWVAPALVYPVILAGTACLGLGFGMLGAPLNSLPPRLFARAADTALVAAHTLLGAGLMAGPLLVAALSSSLGWVAFPLLLALACALFALLVLATPVLAQPPHTAVAHATGGERAVGSPAFWLFAAIAVLYAFAEGTFSSWAVVYLGQTRGLAEPAAAAALSAFWGALVGGRLLVSVLVLRVAPQRIWLALPWLMIAAFLALPHVASAAGGIVVFALAGVACSAFFPLSIALASARHPAQVPWVSSMMIAALMIGVGLGSFAVGALREILSFETLYRASTLYPVLALLLAGVLLRRERGLVQAVPS